MLIYIPFNSCQNLMSQIMSENGFGSIGFLLLGIFYVGKIGGSLVQNKICSALGRSKTFTLGAFMLGMLIYTEIVPAIKADQTKDESFFLSHSQIEGVLIVGNLIVGFGAALIWVA